MKRSNRLVLLIGIFLALVVFALIAFTYRPGGPDANASPTPPTTAAVVVAATDIDLGATITADMVTTKDMAVADKPVNSYGDTALVIGQIARAPVTSGQAITSTILNGSSGGVSDIQVPPGFVAMAVQVDQVTGVGTIIKPGDFVDVISGFTTMDKWPEVVTNPQPAPGAAFLQQPLTYPTTSVKVLSQGLQVLGTLLPPPTDNGTATASPGASSPPSTTTLNGQQQIVILAVPMQDAEVIKFSQMDGSISLVLRSSKDCTTKPADGATYCPVVPTSGITLRRLVDDRGVLPPQVIQVIDPTPYPSRKPGASASPAPSASAPAGSPAASASTTP